MSRIHDDQMICRSEVRRQHGRSERAAVALAREFRVQRVNQACLVDSVDVLANQ
jgi:hypothetical protein